MVTFQTPDGTPGFHQSDTLDEAITFVERLRNEQGVHNSRIFRMEELKFDFKPYYKVEISAGADNGAGGLSAPERATASSRPAPPKAAASLDLTGVSQEEESKDDDDAASTPDTAPEPVGAAATPAASTSATPPPPPPPPPPAKDVKSEEPTEAPRRGLFTR